MGGARNEIHVSKGTSWFGILTPKVDMPILVTLIIWIPAIQWLVVRCASNKVNTTLLIMATQSTRV